MSAAMLSGVEAARLAQGYLEEAPVRSIFFSAAPEAAADGDASHPAASAATPAAVRPAATGVSAPDFALDVIGGTRKVRLADFAGRPVVLLFNSAKTAEEANAINLRLRSRQPDHRALPIVTVVSSRGIPQPFRGIAHGSMEKSYTRSSYSGAPGLRGARDRAARRHDGGRVYRARLGWQGDGGLRSWAI